MSDEVKPNSVEDPRALEWENLPNRCRANPKWAATEIAQLRKLSKSHEMEIIRLRDDLRFAVEIADGTHAQQSARQWKRSHV